jgi:hypothetical protein
MKATLKLEAIGDNFCAQLRGYKNLCNAFGYGELMDGISFRHPWVAKIIGLYASGKFQREFLGGNKDYSESNSKGSRGIFFWYTLESGNYYDVYELVSWKNDDRYYCKVDEKGDVIIVDEKEIELFFTRQIMNAWKEKKKDAARTTENAGD